jgi:putative GTP pyrophosphokinase
VVSVPVFLSDGAHVTPVEIQLRTVAMDYWASLEHKLHYKNDHIENDENVSKLKEYADQLYEIETAMQEIHRKIR